MKLPKFKLLSMQTFVYAYFILSAIVIWRLVVNIKHGVNVVVPKYVDRIVKDVNKIEHQQKPYDYEADKEKIRELKKETDSFRAIMGSKDAQIIALTKVRGQTQDSVRLLNIALDEEKNKTWHWERLYKSGSKTVATMNEKDSVLVYKADLKINVLDIVEGKGRNARYYTDISTPDDNITFNGGKVIRTEKKIPKRALALMLKNDLYFSGSRPFMYKPEIELQLIPDSWIIPKIGTGILIDFDNRERLFWKVGIDLPIKTSSK